MLDFGMFAMHSEKKMKLEISYLKSKNKISSVLNSFQKTTQQIFIVINKQMNSKFLLWYRLHRY